MRLIHFSRFLVLGASLLILFPPALSLGQMNMAMGTGDAVPPEKLPAPEHMAGVGNARFPITANPEAQLWFEQGYNLLYDFWDYEADRAFQQSIRVDGHCAMCYWGLYLGETSRHNADRTYAEAALGKAVALSAGVSARERLYIQAAEAQDAAIREAGSASSPKLDKQVEVLRRLVKENSADTNARILLAEAVGEGYDEQGAPKKGTKEMLALLQGVLTEEPQNSVANHLWIHAVEASPHPEQALHSAEILGSLAPASGHMVHMPGHIFYRTGDYARAQACFDASTSTDENYMRQQHVAPDDDWNYVHNLMYSIANLLEAGRMRDAIQVSGKLVNAHGHSEESLYAWSARDSVARLHPELPVALRTADWGRVVQLVNAANLSQAMPRMEFLAGGLAQFALGMQSVEAQQPEAGERHAVLLDAALWRMGQQIKAEEAEQAKKGPLSADPMPKPLLAMLSIMSLELRGSLLASQKNVAEAEKMFAMAQREEKELGYHEPPFYIRPVAESEAAAMMTAGFWPEAKEAFLRAEKDRPRSGFALYGVAQALEKSGDVGGAGLGYRDFLSAWKDADGGLPQVQHAREWVRAHGTAGSG